MSPRRGRAADPLCAAAPRPAPAAGWHIHEWAFAALLFGLLLLYPVWNGYPFLFPDSWGYYGVCPDEMRSPVLGCALRPVTLAGGPWAFAAVQCAATALSLAYLWGPAARHGAMASPWCLALLASGVGFYSGWLMADVWSLFGTLGLFAVATGRFRAGRRGPADIRLRDPHREFPHLRRRRVDDAALRGRAR